MGKIETEKQTVAYMIGLYCKKKHKMPIWRLKSSLQKLYYPLL